MDDLRPIGPARRRIGGLAVLVPLAFLAGVLLAAYLIRARYWVGFVAQPAPAAIVIPQPLPTRIATPVASDPASLSAREIALAGQLASLEARARTASADEAASGAQAGRAEALLVLAATRRALDRGLPLGYLDGALGQRFPDQLQAVATIRAAARQPVLLEDLRQGLGALAGDTGSTGEDWRTTLSRELGNLVLLRHAKTPTPPLGERLATAQRLVDASRVDAARAQVAGVANGRGWLASANRYLAARQALDTLERAALTAPQAPDG